MKNSKHLKIWATLFLIIASLHTFCQFKTIPVFVSGKEGHKSYRIPAIIKANDGALLAFAEGRVNGSGDFGDINIVLKKSIDGGNTWSSLQTVVDADSLQAGNPAPVLDMKDPAYPDGRIFLFYNTGNNHENEVRKGKGLREVWYKTSIDGGNTWSDAVNITLQTHRPKQPQVNPAYNFKEDWRSYANTPGHAIQISSGKYKGRLYVAANHSAGDPLKKFEDYHAHGFYTDDHGKTFHLSNDVSIDGSNESMAVELSKDRLMMNSRNQQGDTRARIVAISNNGGASWDTAYFDSNLPDPVCQGSILRMDKSTLIFCNAADVKRRDNLTVRVSVDEGKTWKQHILIDKSNQSLEDERTDHIGYSDLVSLKKATIGVLYEKDNYGKIVFTRIAIQQKKLK